MKETLTIAISTNTKTLTPLYERLVDYVKKLNGKVLFLVSYQSDVTYENKETYGVTFIRNKELGISSNRNLCIKFCNTKWLWFQDDDIKLNLDTIDELLVALRNGEADLFFIKIGSLENNSENYKNYNFYNCSRFFVPFKVSSIEIIVNKNFIQNHNLEFDVNLGLGTALPSGEENVFIIDCLNANATYKFLDIKACFHTTLEENRQIKSQSYFESKGYVLSKISIFAAIVLSIRWALRERKKVGIIKVIKHNLNGYRFKQSLKKKK